MGILSDIFETKVKLWESPDEETYLAYCKELRSAGLKIQAFTVNQRTVKCSGNCASCAAINQEEDEEIGYRKLGRGCSDDLLNEKKPYDIYAIYVKKSDTSRAMELLGITELPPADTREPAAAC